jgi:hypothetical protein
MAPLAVARGHGAGDARRGARGGVGDRARRRAVGRRVRGVVARPQAIGARCAAASASRGATAFELRVTPCRGRLACRRRPGCRRLDLRYAAAPDEVRDEALRPRSRALADRRSA